MDRMHLVEKEGMTSFKLEYAIPITPHANVRTYFSFPVAAILLVVWSANGDTSALTNSKASSSLLNDDTYRCVCAGNCVIHPDKQSKVLTI